jgi:FHA domain-containing protein
MPAPAGVAPGSRAAGASPASPQPATRLPDDFDPFAAPAPARPGPEPEQSGNTFADLLPRAGGASIDNLFGLSGPGANAGSAADPLAQFMASAPAASPTAPSPWDRPTPPAPQGVPATSGAVSTDPLALFGGTDAPPPSRAPTAPNHTPDLHAGFVAPQVAAAAPIPEPVAHSAILPTGLHWLQPAGAGASPTPSTALRPGDGTGPAGRHRAEPVHRQPARSEPAGYIPGERRTRRHAGIGGRCPCGQRSATALASMRVACRRCHWA